jgi:hypothetical protein
MVGRKSHGVLMTAVPEGRSEPAGSTWEDKAQILFCLPQPCWVCHLPQDFWLTQGEQESQEETLQQDGGPSSTGHGGP